jgi:hypothetical protein
MPSVRSWMNLALSISWRALTRISDPRPNCQNNCKEYKANNRRQKGYVDEFPEKVYEGYNLVPSDYDYTIVAVKINVNLYHMS